MATYVESTAPVGDDPGELVDALVQISFLTMAALNKVGAENGLSLNQLRLLGTLRDWRLKKTELADRLGLDRSTTSDLVDRAGKSGLLTQLRRFRILRGRRLKMSELADYLGLDRSAMYGLVARAGKRGLLKRSPNPQDGRAVDVLLSADGVELAERVAVQVEQALSPMTSALARADVQRLAGLLDQLLDER